MVGNLDINYYSWVANAHKISTAIKCFGFLLESYTEIEI